MPGLERGASPNVSTDPTHPAPQAIEAELRAGARDGSLSVALVDNWQDLELWGESHPDALADILHTAAGLDTSVAGTEEVALQSFGVALVNLRGDMRVASPRFRELIEDPSALVSCRELLRRAQAGGQTLGLVQTEKNGVVCLLAAFGEASRKWREFPGMKLGAEVVGVSAALIAFAPSFNPSVLARAADAYGLSVREAELLTALMRAPDLAVAAAAIGLGRDTAKTVISSAMRKVGAENTPQLVARIMDLTRPVGAGGTISGLEQTLGLSPSETRVARALGAGFTARDAARTLGLSEQTVAAYRRSVFEKTGVKRARDLGRLLAEIEGLYRVSSTSELVFDPAPDPGRLRVLIDDSGRRVAFIDYGPPNGRPVVMGHAPTSGRIAPPPLLEQMRRSGRRLIIPQRPGFGLTSPALTGQLETSVADLSLILDRLGLAVVDVISRHAASACAFLEHEPDRLRRVVLVNTQEPRTSTTIGVVGAITRLLIANPALIEAFGRMMGRQGRSDLVRRMVLKIASTVPADRACMTEQRFIEHVVRDAQGLVGPTVNGFIREQQVFVGDWRPPTSLHGVDLVYVQGAPLHAASPAAIWQKIPGLHEAVVPDAGWFIQYTHPEALVALLD